MTAVGEGVAHLAGVHTWWPAATPRGTLLVLPGRGEHGGLYERFGRRLAYDGYVVHAVDTAGHDGPGAVARALEDAAGPDPAEPVVLVGADTGALRALRAAEAGGALPVAGIVVAGIAPVEARADGLDPVHPDLPAPSGGWNGELAARTACPAHRQLLTIDAEFSRGALARPVPVELVPPATPSVPVLFVHGDADPVTSLTQARGVAERLSRAELATVRGGLHDVLNDLSHRTVAAAVTQWLERLRAAPALAPILTFETVEGSSR